MLYVLEPSNSPRFRNSDLNKRTSGILHIIWWSSCGGSVQVYGRSRVYSASFIRPVSDTANHRAFSQSLPWRSTIDSSQFQCCLENLRRFPVPTNCSLVHMLSLITYLLDTQEYSCTLWFKASCRNWDSPTSWLFSSLILRVRLGYDGYEACQKPFVISSAKPKLRRNTGIKEKKITQQASAEKKKQSKAKETTNCPKQ